MRALARVLYRQQRLDTDLRKAAALYQFLAASEVQPLDPVDHGYMVDLLTTMGRRQEARTCLNQYQDGLRELEAYTYLLANLLNPHTGGPGSEIEWLHELNAPLITHSLESVKLNSGGGTPFCRLNCEATSRVTDGPLISVLMPVYECNDAADVAIRSILAQSWTNLELIIVDDASNTVSRERLKKWEGADARLRIVYSDENRGAYSARNIAYELARGEFVTVADKDDWHHPRKLEFHARDLVDQPDKLANLSCWSRVDENLSFLVRYAPIRMAHPSQPSLFFRREPVKSALGYWDSVRKGADGEYKLRIERVFNTEIKPMNRVPLALSLMGRDNLSSQDFGLGYEHPDRSSYKDTYRHWHRRLGESVDPYVPKRPLTRPFPAPAAFLPTRHRLPCFDVVFALDLATDSAASELIRNEVFAGIDRGMRTAVVHLPDLMLLSRRHRLPADWLADLIVDGKVTRISLTDRVDADFLLLAGPRLLQYRPAFRCEIVSRRTSILVDQLPLDSAAGGYCPDDVSRNAHSMFNARAIWVPANNDMRLALRRWLARRKIAPYDWSGIGKLQRDCPLQKVALPGQGTLKLDAKQNSSR